MSGTVYRVIDRGVTRVGFARNFAEQERAYLCAGGQPENVYSGADPK